MRAVVVLCVCAPASCLLVGSTQWFYRCSHVSQQARKRAGSAFKEGRDLFYSIHEDVVSEKMLSEVVKVVAVAANYCTIRPGPLALPRALSSAPPPSFAARPVALRAVCHVSRDVASWQASSRASGCMTHRGRCFIASPKSVLSERCVCVSCLCSMRHAATPGLRHASTRSAVAAWRKIRRAHLRREVWRGARAMRKGATATRTVS